jgi:hypothetical protein
LGGESCGAASHTVVHRRDGVDLIVVSREDLLHRRLGDIRLILDILLGGDPVAPSMSG